MNSVHSSSGIKCNDKVRDHEKIMYYMCLIPRTYVFILPHSLETWLNMLITNKRWIYSREHSAIRAQTKYKCTNVWIVHRWVHSWIVETLSLLLSHWHCMQSGSESFPLVASANPVADIISHEVCSHTLSLGDSDAVVCLLNFTVRYTYMRNIFSRTFTFSEIFTVEHTRTFHVLICINYWNKSKWYMCHL